MTNEKLCLSVTEAARILGLSRPTVYRLTHRKDFPTVRVGSRTLISRSGLEHWINDQTNADNAF